MSMQFALVDRLKMRTYPEQEWKEIVTESRR